MRKDGIRDLFVKSEGIEIRIRVKFITEHGLDRDQETMYIDRNTERERLYVNVENNLGTSTFKILTVSKYTLISYINNK